MTSKSPINTRPEYDDGDANQHNGIYGKWNLKLSSAKEQDRVCVKHTSPGLILKKSKASSWSYHIPIRAVEMHVNHKRECGLTLSELRKLTRFAAYLWALAA
jgi:hypothetical protein